jgi:hypothetical protein
MLRASEKESFNEVLIIGKGKMKTTLKKEKGEV